MQQSQKCIASVQYPETESDIISLQPGWAEQSPDLWWENVKQAILKCNATKIYDPLILLPLALLIRCTDWCWWIKTNMF